MSPNPNVLIERARQAAKKAVDEKLKTLEKKLQEDKSRMWPRRVENVVTITYM